jgi:hypothetical protein
MANKKKNVYEPKPMTEGKKNLIQGLMPEYDIETPRTFRMPLRTCLQAQFRVCWRRR